MYYENMQSRKGKVFDLKNSQISLYPGNTTLQIITEKDTLLFFSVLELKELRNWRDSLEYLRIPSIYYNEDSLLVAGEDIRLHISEKQKRDYIVYIDYEHIIPYRLCSDCKSLPTEISFFNRENGNIYFIERSCYLELIYKTDLNKIIKINN
ncbi:hypothetical protein V9L05_17240 [Bernardetia sp. Wsw4-3y2]